MSFRSRSRSGRRAPAASLALVLSASVAAAQGVEGDPVTEQDWSQFFPAEAPVDVRAIKDAQKPHLLPYVVAVRDAGAELRSGVVVAERERRCVVATVGPLDGSVAVRLHDAPDWIPVEQPRTEATGELVFLDVLLPEERSSSPLARFFVAPSFTVFEGVPANLVAPEEGADGALVWSWSKATLASGPEERVLFRGERLVPPGTALLNTDLEFVGLVLAGDDPQTGRAISHADLQRRAEAAGIELDLVADAVHSSLVAASRQRRIATLCVRAESAGRHVNYWFAIELRLQIGTLFSGRIIGYRHGSYAEFDYARDGLAGNWPKNLGVDLEGLERLELLPPDALPGFFAFRAQAGESLAQLALPQGNAQLLGTLALVAGVNSAWLRNYGGRVVAPYLSGVAGGRPAVEIEGQDPLFPLHVPAREDGSGGLSLRLPEPFATVGGRVTALVALTDVHEEVDKPVKLHRMDAYEFRLFGDGPEPLATWKAADSRVGRIDVGVPPGTRELRWTTVGRSVPQAIVTLAEAVLSAEPD